MRISLFFNNVIEFLGLRSRPVFKLSVENYVNFLRRREKNFKNDRYFS